MTLLERLFRWCMLRPGDVRLGALAHYVAQCWRVLGRHRDMERVRALFCYCRTAPQTNEDWPCWVCGELRFLA